MLDSDLSWDLLRRPAVALVIAAVTVVGLLSAISIDRAHAVVHKPIRWLFNGPGVAAIAADAVVTHLLDNAQPFIMMGRRVDVIPPGWRAVPFASFTNFGAIKNALELGRLGPEVRGVMYDYEKWRFTPEEEQRNPAGYVKQAADLVHAQQLLFLTAPAVNLVTVMAPSEDRNRMFDTYLRLGIAADAARYADVFDIQAQGSECNTEVYAKFVRQAAAQARQANPRVVVLAGISTQPSGQQVTVDDILRAIAATRDFVDVEYCPGCT